MTFSDYNYKPAMAMRYPEGVYIHLKLMNESEEKLKIFLNTYLPGIEINTPHCTLIYSKKPLDAPIITKRYQVKAKFDGYDIFGDEKVLVAKLDCPKIVKRNAELVEEYGFISDFSEYKPHISIKWNFEGDINSIPDINFPLYFNEETVEKLNLDWKD